MAAVPRHIAIIMDGNGRWAEARGMMRIRGHEAGVDAVRAVAEECSRLKIGQLTVYAFSAENWKRPRLEIELLMQLLKRFLVNERDNMMNNDIKLTAVGRLDALPAYVLRELEDVREFKFIQHETRLAEVLIVPRGAWSEMATRRVVAGIQGRLGQDCAVEITLMEAIAPEASGKHRYVVSHVKLPF